MGKPMKQTTIRGSQPSKFGRPAIAPPMRYTELPGRYVRVNGINIDWRNPVELKGQNGFWAVHKLHKCSVFVVETGAHKGQWIKLDSPF